MFSAYYLFNENTKLATISHVATPNESKAINEEKMTTIGGHKQSHWRLKTLERKE